ncbi:hypothetical protein CP10139811_0318 [Chlamydia ibidis]|uniref:Uncharacterized protein n=2 Tax=Chlamydia ibidis TaxID=1405396 RepID=S7J1V4_9CHLA|nr:hypothetical protein [Chlamydia ibidis]EPP34389.1 hypothetical protein CP10139811_0318 [Chlamydia ibidis]EQM62892.1 hypothetical protein H359_0436 [Chlamydia ibidis 10-1398/6]
MVDSLSSLHILPSSSQGSLKKTEPVNSYRTIHSSSKLFLYWNDYREHLLIRSMIAFILMAVASLGFTTLMSYAILNSLWLLFGLTVTTIILMVSVALLVALQVKHRVLGTSLFNEISENMLSATKTTTVECSHVCEMLKSSQFYNLKEWHDKLLVGKEKEIADKEAHIKQLETTIFTLSNKMKTKSSE